MRVVYLHPSAQHIWPQFSVCLSCVFSASPVTTQLGPVRFGNNQEQEATRSNTGAREKACSNLGHFCCPE
jgi:hypothetical protein